jgi:hypothetical protein
MTNGTVELSERDKDILSDLDAGMVLLRLAIKKLEEDAKSYYAVGNNLRGNIRFDAAKDLTTHIDYVIYDYLRKALVKGYQ